MGPEFVTLLAGGMQWSGFEKVMVRAAFTESARTFNVTIAAEPVPSVAAWAFKAGTAVDILFNGALACRGYVDRYQPRLGEHSQAQIMVSGRSKGQDMIDSSAEHSTGRFKQKTPAEIGQELDKFGIGISTDEALDKVDYQLTPGETVFRCLEKLCRSQGVFMPAQPDGSVLITRAKGSHAGALIEGANLKAGEADHNWSGRHSKVIVRGQRPYGSGPDALQIEAIAQDAEVGRNRPVIVVQDDDTDKKRADKRAKHRRDREAGNSLKANITVQGFRDDGGMLWTPGRTVFVDSAFLDIHQAMAIDVATFTQARGHGSETVLQLVDPRALGGQSGKGGTSGAAWATGAGG